MEKKLTRLEQKMINGKIPLSMHMRKEIVRGMVKLMSDSILRYIDDEESDVYKIIDDWIDVNDYDVDEKVIKIMRQKFRYEMNDVVKAVQVVKKRNNVRTSKIKKDELS